MTKRHLPAALARAGATIMAAPPAPTPNAEVRELFDQLQQTFGEFRQANDERIKALESGKADALLDQKVDKANAAIDGLKTQIDKALADLSALQVGGAGGDREADEAMRHNALLFHAARRSDGDPVLDVTAEQVEGYRAFTRSFEALLRRGGSDGDRLSPDVRAALQVGSAPDGGYWVPTEMGTTVATRLFETSDVRALASVIQISTADIEFPTDTNEATSGGWVGEAVTRSGDTGTPQVGVHKIVAHEQYAEPHATQKLLDDAAVDVEGWLSRKVADILVRTENTAFVTGNGVAKPRGFLDYKTGAATTDDASRAWGKLQYVVTGASADFPVISGTTTDDPDPLVTLISKLKPAYRSGAVWAMNRSVEAAVRKLKDADGRYLIGMGDLQDGVRGFNLLGFPIRTMEDMPDLAADSFSIAFGNFREGYLVVDRQGIRVLRDPYTKKGFVKFYTTKRVGGDVLNFDAIKLLKFGTS
ncbi:MAG: phage major capsid protein [Acetobacterales bacterium]